MRFKQFLTEGDDLSSEYEDVMARYAQIEKDKKAYEKMTDKEKAKKEADYQKRLAKWKKDARKAFNESKLDGRDNDEILAFLQSKYKAAEEEKKAYAKLSDSEKAELKKKFKKKIKKWQEQIRKERIVM